MALTKILVGTSKGLVVAESRNNREWSLTDVHFEGMPVSMIYCDERSNTWWAGLTHRHWGQKLHYSRDQGNIWHSVDVPIFAADTTMPSGQSASLKKIWCMQHAGADRKDGLWIGTEPGALFYSADYGETFELVKGLWNHPSRNNSGQWFGAGRNYSFIHSIVIDPRDSSHVYVAVSCAGVFETWDAGTTWNPINNGLRAAYLPDPAIEVGHDPHLLLVCKSNPETLWQQNHCGIFRSIDGGKKWTDVSDHTGLANYGFCLAIDDNDANKAWVIPAKSDEQRIPKDLALCVCHTEDGGISWKEQRQGLSQEYCFDIVLRHALDRVGSTMSFGTSCGSLYVSQSEGENWTCIANNLARIESTTIVKLNNGDV